MSVVIVPTYATQVAALAAAAEARLLERVRRAGATSPALALALDPREPMERSALRRLAASGVLVRAAPGRYWLDETAAAARERRTRRVAGAAVAVMAVVGLAAILLLELLAR